MLRFDRNNFLVFQPIFYAHNLASKCATCLDTIIEYPLLFNSFLLLCILIFVYVQIRLNDFLVSQPILVHVMLSE